MRIDHFFVSDVLRSRTAGCIIKGKVERQSSDCDEYRAGFMGSDHCPIVLELRGPQPDEGSAD